MVVLGVNMRVLLTLLVLFTRLGVPTVPRVAPRLRSSLNIFSILSVMADIELEVPPKD